MEKVTIVLSTISAWAVSATAIIAALAAIFKPFRRLLSRIMKIGNTSKEVMKKIMALQSDVANIHTEISDLSIEVNAKLEESNNNCNQNIEACKQELSAAINAVDEHHKINERDRLKQEIFTFGNRARKREHISSEEFRYLQQVFEKYTSLGGNDIAHDEYNFVADYYNNKCWEQA